ncbi:hypothetical protein [Rhodococcus qingshengii]
MVTALPALNSLHVWWARRPSPLSSVDFCPRGR